MFILTRKKARSLYVHVCIFPFEDTSVGVNAYKGMFSFSKEIFWSRALLKSYANSVNVCKERGQAHACALVVWDPAWSGMLGDAHKISQEILKKCASTVQFMHIEALRKIEVDILHMLS